MNPQLENGYTRIANEIQDAFCCFRIPGQVRTIIDCIIRKTYGYHKKEDRISNSQFVQMTGMRKGNVSRALSCGITHKIVILQDNKLSLNKNYKEWISFDYGKRGKLSAKITGVIIQDNKKLSAKRDTKDNKDNITKDTFSKENGDKPRYVGKRNPEIELILSTYKEYLGFKPTDRSPRRVAQTFRQSIHGFIREDRPEAKFEDILKKIFIWYMARDQIKGETLDVVRRKAMLLMEKAHEKGGKNDIKI